jgi:hypothetical protein
LLRARRLSFDASFASKSLVITRLAQRPSRLPGVYASKQREIINPWNPTRPPYSA